MKNRIEYIDCVKGVALLAIITSHIVGVTDFNYFLSNFHVPIFFIVTGLLFKLNETLKKSFKDLLKEKSKTILYPYFVFSIITFLYYLAVTDFDMCDLIVKETIILNGFLTLWFLITLYFSELLFFATHKLIKSKKTNIFLFVFLLIAAIIINTLIDVSSLHGHYIFNNINRIIIGYIFICVGYYLYTYTDKLIANNPIITIIIFVVTLILSTFNGKIDLNHSIIDIPVLYFVFAISLSLMIISLIKLLYKKKRLKIIEYIGKNSLIIMFTHLCLPITTYWVLLLNVRSYTGMLYCLLIILCLLCICVVEIFISFLVNKFFPFILRPSLNKKD